MNSDSNSKSNRPHFESPSKNQDDVLNLDESSDNSKGFAADVAKKEEPEVINISSGSCSNSD